MPSGIDHFVYHTLYGDASNIPLCCNLFFTGAWVDHLVGFLKPEIMYGIGVKNAKYIQCPECIARCLEGEKKPRKLIKDDRIPNIKEIRKVYRREISTKKKSLK